MILPWQSDRKPAMYYLLLFSDTLNFSWNKIYVNVLVSNENRVHNASKSDIDQVCKEEMRNQLG